MNDPTRDQNGAMAPPDADAVGHASRPAAIHALGLAMGAIFTIWLAPRWTTRRCQHTPLWAAWSAHLLAILIAAAIGLWGAAPAGIWEDLVRARRGPLVFSARFVLLEVGFVFLAFLWVPWSAQDEPLRRTCRHALRTVWLWTGSAIPLLVIWFAVPSFRREWMALMVVAMPSWGLFVLFRAGATPRTSPPQARPPMCEVCGYNLSHTPPDSRCPECGTPVRESLHSGVRRPNEWERTRQLAAFDVLYRCDRAVIRRPRQFFRAMETRQGLPRARTLLMLHFALAAAISVLCALYLSVMRSESRGDMLLAVALSLIVAFCTLLYVLLLAAVVGVCCRLAWKRNVMPGVAKVFCYTYGLFIGVCVVCALSMGPMIGLVFLADVCGLRPGEDVVSAVLFLAWLAIWVSGLGLHLYVALLGVRQIRYANS